MVKSQNTKINTNELNKAIDSLKESITLYEKLLIANTNQDKLVKVVRDGIIQRFEYCVELSWKTSMKILGLEAKAPNPAIRDMARNNLIDDTELWFELLVARNKTSHSYDEDIAAEVYSIAKHSVAEFEKLKNKLAEMIR